MNMPHKVNVVNVGLPGPVVEAVLAIEDLGAAIGELRCLSSVVYSTLMLRREVNEYRGGDVATEALLAVISRLGEDHPSALPGAIVATDCGCHRGAGVLEAVRAVIAAVPPAPPVAPPEEPSTGAYL